MASDAHLVAMVRDGRAAAFEALYDRHSRAILSFCRHMLGSVEEAEDAVQHTFLAAYNDLISSRKEIQLRAWLFAIARNRCYSILRARREQPSGDLDEATTEGLATQVQRRQDLRDLVGDMRQLPDDQRAALVLSEMDALTHEQIGDVLGVPKDKVKALVFQARESLVASRAARETDCSDIREQLANLRGGALRRANLRRHLRECPGCRAFRKDMEHQRRQLRLLLPVAPTIGLKEAVLGATIGGGTGAGLTGGGMIAGSLFKTGALKGIVGGIIAGVGTASTFVAVSDMSGGPHSPFSGLPKLVGEAPLTPAPTVARAYAHRATFATFTRTSGRSRAAGSAGFTRLTGTPVALRISRRGSRSRDVPGGIHSYSRGGRSLTVSNPVVHGAPSSPTTPAAGVGVGTLTIPHGSSRTSDSRGSLGSGSNGQGNNPNSIAAPGSTTTTTTTAAPSSGSVGQLGSGSPSSGAGNSANLGSSQGGGGSGSGGGQGGGGSGGQGGGGSGGQGGGGSGGGGGGGGQGGGGGSGGGGGGGRGRGN